MLEQVVGEERVERPLEVVDHVFDLPGQDLVVDGTCFCCELGLQLDSGQEVDSFTQRAADAACSTAHVQEPAEAPTRKLGDEFRASLAEVRRRLRIPRRNLHRRWLGLARMATSDQTWDETAKAELRRDFEAAYANRTCLVTGADGFMGSHLTEALVGIGAHVVAFVRATSSGALNNIGQLRDDLTVVFADLTDKTSIDHCVRDHLASAPDRPYVFHLGAQAHVGESWHRPYETVMANTLGTLNLLQSIVDLDVELEKFDTAGTSEEYGNVRETVAHHHDFDSAGSLILHERSPINPSRSTRQRRSPPTS